MSCPQDLFSDFDNVRDLVNHTLCDHEELEPDAFPLTEQVLERSGQPIGVFFCLHGPRSVRYTAIWETARNVVLFYGSTGERFRTVELGARKSSPRVAWT
ncbi:MAG: hypothetical protein QM811_02250 [Pirellulales bacterium]